LFGKNDGGSRRRGTPPAISTRPQGEVSAGELTFCTFNVRIAADKGVNGIGHIDTLLRTCSAKGYDVIGLQETKRNGTKYQSFGI
jgi:hypothetical protein